MGDVGKLVSVIVPIYQAEAYLAECIESILHQDYRDVEIILVDDGSEDGSGKLCDNYAGQYCNVFCVHQRNRGVSNARNRGIEQAKGEYILFVDSDDCIAPDYLARAIIAFENGNVDMYLCGYQNVAENGKATREKHYPKISDGSWKVHDLRENMLKLFPTWTLHAIGTKIYKRSIIEGNAIRFQEKWKFFEDIYFCLEYLAHANEVYVQNEIMYYYRNGIPNSLSQLKVNCRHACIHDTFSLLNMLINLEQMRGKHKASFYKMYYGNINLCINAAISIEQRYNNKLRGLYKTLSKDAFYRKAVGYAGKHEKTEYFFIENKLFFLAYLVRRYLISSY